ncbi:MAG: hypothetical protein P8L78_17620 [Mariniblastus sp.]|nr:hypothetical protein [Mariniblastus sp.]
MVNQDPISCSGQSRLGAKFASRLTEGIISENSFGHKSAEQNQNKSASKCLDYNWYDIFQSNADISKSNHCVRKDAGLNPEDSIHG